MDKPPPHRRRPSLSPPQPSRVRRWVFLLSGLLVLLVSGLLWLDGRYGGPLPARLGQTPAARTPTTMDGGAGDYLRGSLWLREDPGTP